MSVDNTCSVCNCEPDHLNNHVRMSKGDGHGPYGQYPDGWDKEAGGFVSDDDPDGGSREIAPESDDDPDDEPDELAELTIEDSTRDMRDYQCSADDCSKSVDYGADTCGDGHEQEWFA